MERTIPNLEKGEIYRNKTKLILGKIVLQNKIRKHLKKLMLIFNPSNNSKKTNKKQLNIKITSKQHKNQIKTIIRRYIDDKGKFSNIIKDF